MKNSDSINCKRCARITEYVSRIGTDSKKWDGCAANFAGKDILPLWIADSDFAAPPEVLSAIRERATHPVFGYGVKPPEFYDAAVSWFTRRHAWKLEQEWIQTTPGVIPALASCVQAFTSPGEEVIVQPPVFPNFFSVVRNFGRNILENPLRYDNGTYYMDLADLKRKITSKTKLFILCNPHNPGGRVWTKEELQAVAKICAENGIIVVSDELNCDITLFGNRYTPFATISDDAAENSVICTAPSKTFNLAGLSTSLIIARNEGLRGLLRNVIEGYGLYETNNFGMAAFIAAYKYGAPWLEALRCYYECNAMKLKTAISEECPGINMELPQSSFTAWLDCRELGLTDGQLAEFFTDYAKVGVNLGVRYGQQGSGFARLNFGCREELLDEAVAGIKTALKSYSS